MIKYVALYATVLVTSISAWTLFPQGQSPLVAETERYLIELGPGETRWINEDEKWVLKRVCLSDL